MSLTRPEDDPNKPVTGYPAGHNSYNPNNYPPAQPNNNHYNHHTSTAPPTAYPYTAPPPATYYNHNYNPNPYPTPYYDDSNYRRRATFLRRLILAAIAVFIIIGSITFIVWLILRPRLPEFRLDSASVSNFNVSGSQVTANWDFGFSVRNPNKKMIVYYDRIEGAVLYRDEPIAENLLVPFDQGKRNETTIHARFSALGAYVGDGYGGNLAADRTRGDVNFNVRMVAWVRFRSGAWRTRRHLMRVYCRNVKVGFSSNSGAGTLSGGPRMCDVDL